MAYLDTIDDLEATTAVNFTDIASVEPTFFIDGLTRILLICTVTYEQRLEEKRVCITFIVDSETVLTTDADFTARIRLVIGGIVHVGDVDKLDLVARLRRSDSTTRCWVIGPDASTSTTVLGHSVT